jgi:hypothetical protein
MCSVPAHQSISRPNIVGHCLSRRLGVTSPESARLSLISSNPYDELYELSVGDRSRCIESFCHKVDYGWMIKSAMDNRISNCQELHFPLAQATAILQLSS